MNINKNIYKRNAFFAKSQTYAHKKKSDFYITLHENNSIAPVVLKMTRTIFHLEQHSCKFFLFLACIVYTFTLASSSIATYAILTPLHFVTSMTAARLSLLMTKADLDMT